MSRSDSGNKGGRLKKRVFDAEGVVLVDMPAMQLATTQSIRAAGGAAVGLEQWNDGQLSNLRSELDSLLVTARALGRKLGGEVDHLGSMLKKAGGDGFIEAIEGMSGMLDLLFACHDLSRVKHVAVTQFYVLFPFVG